MEKVEEFRVTEDTIEDWIEGLEARLDALNIRDNGKKIKWCKAVIGTVGRGILKNVDPQYNWDQVKQELFRYFGEDDSKAAAWRKLKSYRAGTKTLGEIAGDLLGMARAAATEEDVQQRLAIDAFLDAIPWKVAKEVKRKKLDTLKKALEEAKFIMVMNEEEDRKKDLLVDEVQVQKLDEEPPRRNGQVTKPGDGWKRDEPWSRPP